jgi:hypothetical protein
MIISEPTARKTKLEYPDKYSEFEVQAELYNRLKQEGLTVRGEVRGSCNDGNKTVGCRFDLVIFNSLKRPVLIIECKNNRSHDGRKTIFDRVKTRQYRKYSKFELPTFQCLSMNHIDAVVFDVMAALKNLPFA